MRKLPGIAGRLNRRQFVAVIVAASGLAVILVAVALHSTGLPSFFPGGETGTVQAGDGITVEEPPPEVTEAPVVADPNAPPGPVVNVGNRTPTGPRPDGNRPGPTTPRSATTTTTAPPPPPTTTSTTLPTLPTVPIGAPPADL